MKKDDLRDRLKDEMAEYLRRGGAIKEIPPEDVSSGPGVVGIGSVEWYRVQEQGAWPDSDED